MPKVYIIILNYGNWADTLECLTSVFQLGYENFAVIVVDNASPNDSLAKMTDWAEGKLSGEIKINVGLNSDIKRPIPYIKLTGDEAKQAKLTDSPPPLIFIGLNDNIGFAGGSNVGARLALKLGADYIWFLNNDTVVAKDSLTELVNVAENDKSLGILGSKLVYYHNLGEVQSLGGRYNKFLGTTSMLKAEGEPDFIVGASMLTPRKFLTDVGLMGEDYFLYYEEIDWAIRARNRYKLKTVSASLVYHKEGASTLGSDRAKKEKSVTSDYYAIRSRLMVTKKYFPHLLPTVTLGLFVTAFNRIRRHQFDRLPMIFKIWKQVIFG